MAVSSAVQLESGSVQKEMAKARDSELLSWRASFLDRYRSSGKADCPMKQFVRLDSAGEQALSLADFDASYSDVGYGCHSIYRPGSARKRKQTPRWARWFPVWSCVQSLRQIDGCARPYRHSLAKTFFRWDFSVRDFAVRRIT